MVDQNLEISLNSEELEKSNHLKDKLFSIIAHDLRNPLNRMLVELAILKKAIRKDEQIDRMEITLKETIELFEGLLQWSKIDGKKNIYNSTKINLNDCILKTLKFYENEILKRQISIEIDLKVNFVYADVNIINTVFKNLISNGILYAAKSDDKRIIEIKAKQISSKTVEIYVSNSGPIFSKELISEFYQQDENIISTSSGLGLSICKLLAELCGWKIDIGNISDQGGAYLTMEIPIYNAESLYSSMNAEKLNFPEEIRIQLKDLKKYKFYQISQIRHTIKSFRDIEHAQAQEWIDQIDLAVNEGNEVEYLHLLSLLDI
jgi:signal transduction histidine kinase